mmetsp:Transcript_31259/g.82784  ORF Transcript_31259/g.82784 Transcript_31259/m.82784 type:complete len:285 (-) Transcript_31259:74-928(-)
MKMLSFAGRHGRGLLFARSRASQHAPLLAAIAPLAEKWGDRYGRGNGQGRHGRHDSWHQHGATHEAAGAATLGALGLAGVLASVSALLAEGERSAEGGVATCEPADDMEAGGGPNGEGPGSWDEAMSRCIPAIVSLKVNTTRAFDTTSPGSSQATGFVVDAEKGLILTNRHVVCPGPVVAEAIFVNHEEVPLKAIYRDPVHDFGIFQFDPKSLKHLPRNADGKLNELELHPEGAKVGLDIRVVGNNGRWERFQRLAILELKHPLPRSLSWRHPVHHAIDQPSHP